MCSLVRCSDTLSLKGAKNCLLLCLNSYFSGEEHETYSGAKVDVRKQIMVECRCRCLCRFSEEERHQILESFNKMENHEVQNAYLRGCVSVVPENQQRRRPRNEDGQARKSNTTPVCKASFFGLHDKESRFKRKVLNFEKDISDDRGHHQNHPAVGKM